MLLSAEPRMPFFETPISVIFLKNLNVKILKSYLETL